MFVYPNLNTIFLFFLTFFFFFLILLRLSTFKLPNAQYAKFERLKILGRTRERLVSGVPGWGDSPQLGPQNSELSYRYNYIDQIFGVGRY